VRWTAEHQMFRQTVREFVASEIAPHADEWEADGHIPLHRVFKQMGDLGFLGLEYDPAYGGQGADHSYTAILGEELARVDTMALAMATGVQTDMATPSLHRFGSDLLKRRYLAPACRGEMVASIAVTEPDAGSDVAGIRTRAVRDGGEYVITGSKLYITNGTQADWLCLLARTSDVGGYQGMSQLVVPTDRAGFSVSRKLDKLGMRASDTAELTFDELRVPVDHLIGEEGRGFQQQMRQFQNERMIAAYNTIGAAKDALARTRAYLAERKAFGAPLLANQFPQFTLAELAAEVRALEALSHACAEDYVAGVDTTRDTTICKLLAGKLIRKVADWCLQFHGGIGYMEETWTARFFRDARLWAIGGGAAVVKLGPPARADGFSAD
jgi:citronellyl-CoA dehydrogenase